MPSQAVPKLVRSLQRTGLFLSQRHHREHHRPPFSVRYCTLTNLMNPVLDGLKIFPAIEWLVLALSGIERRQDTGKRPSTIRPHAP